MAPDGRAYDLLPGTVHSRVALPLDYTPSRDLKPRWGYDRPPIQSLYRSMEAQAGTFRTLLAEIPAFAAQLQAIARHFDPDRLPEPAWLDVPITTIDTALLYTIVRRIQPATYLEIGSGITTCFARRAVKDGRLPTRIVSIDPDPRAQIDAACDVVLRQGLETCDLSVFDELRPGDIVFMDGSHRSFMNSDVTVFMIDVLPRLAPGVLVHIHDVMLPWDYPHWTVPWYWNEQYMLASYLIGAGDKIRYIMPSYFVCTSGLFEDILSSPIVDLGEANIGWRGGGSIWFTHKA